MMDTQYISRRTLTQQRNVIESYALLESLEDFKRELKLRELKLLALLHLRFFILELSNLVLHPRYF